MKNSAHSGREATRDVHGIPLVRELMGNRKMYLSWRTQFAYHSLGLSYGFLVINNYLLCCKYLH